MQEVQVDLRNQTVKVTYDERKTDPEAIAAALKAGGDRIAKMEIE